MVVYPIQHFSLGRIMHDANHSAPATTLNTSALSVAEVAGFTGYSRQTVTKMFEDEPGVLVINRPGTNGRTAAFVFHDAYTNE